MTAPTNEYQTQTFRVPDFRLEQAIKNLRDLSRKAQKLGMPPFKMDSGDPELVPAKGKYGIKGKIRVVPLTVTGGPPVIDGWKFFAKIEHGDDGNLVEGFPATLEVESDRALFDKLTTCEPNCEHCNLRRSRSTTFIFQSTDNPEQKIQVGSTCVEDFSGHDSPQDVVSLATRWLDVIKDFISDEEDGFGMPSRGQLMFSAEDVVAAAVAVIREHGHWVSRDAADVDGSSGDWVQQLMLNSKNFNHTVIDGDKIEAKRILDWITGDRFEVNGNVYRHNLRTMALREAVSFKHIPFLASGAATWHRDQAIAQKRAANPTTSIKLGEEGEKLTLDVRVEKIHFIDNPFGGSDLTILKDLNTNGKLVWFNSGKRTMTEGDTYRITGTVKGHEQRDDVWQTKLTRVNGPEIKLHKHLADNGEDTKTFRKHLKETQHIDARSGQGETALYIASRNYQISHEDRGVVEAILDAGADYTIESKRDRMTPFDQWVVAGDHQWIRMALEKHPELARHWDKRELGECEQLSEEDRNHILAVHQQVVIQDEATKQVEQKEQGKATTTATPEAPRPITPFPSAPNDAPMDAMDDEEDLAGIRIG
ncbi:hypothetical protein [Marinobacter subterrani]|uniref:hypothetical protein n=1 Tax=Marinobacter subterrani TaxID=1658765 RepID=UPI002357AAB9|nr:hypothetical protein [Marinobacter subterrani]